MRQVIKNIIAKEIIRIASTESNHLEANPEEIADEILKEVKAMLYTELNKMKEFDKDLPDREYREAVLTGIAQAESIVERLT